MLPWARSHLHSVRPRPSHASFIVWSSYLHLHGNSSSLGINVTIPVKITNIQVDITFIIPKLIDGVPSHVKGV